MQSNGSLPSKHILSICNRYSGTSELFATLSFTQSTGIHSDSVIGTALRRACGASCIRLHKYVFIIDAFLACNESVLDQDRGSQRREVLGSSRADGPMADARAQ